MSRAARTMFAFTVYLAAVSLSLLLVPNLVLPLFGLPETTEVWIRVAGMLAGFLALYYYVVARTESRPVMWASVLARMSVPAFFAVFIIAGWVDWPLILFGVVDGAAALWTWRELRAADA